MNISIKNNTAILVKEDTLVEDSKKTYAVNFEFDSSWDEIDKAAVFKAGPILVDNVEITNNVCSVPAECLKDGGFSLYVGVRNTEDEEDSGIIWCNAGKIMFNIVDGKGGSDDEGGGSEYNPLDGKYIVKFHWDEGVLVSDKTYAEVQEAYYNDSEVLIYGLDLDTGSITSASAYEDENELGNVCFYFDFLTVTSKYGIDLTQYVLNYDDTVSDIYLHNGVEENNAVSEGWTTLVNLSPLIVTGHKKISGGASTNDYESDYTVGEIVNAYKQGRTVILTYPKESENMTYWATLIAIGIESNPSEDTYAYHILFSSEDLEGPFVFEENTEEAILAQYIIIRYAYGGGK